MCVLPCKNVKIQLKKTNLELNEHKNDKILVN